MQVASGMKMKHLVPIILLALSSALAVPAVGAEETAQEKPVGKRDMAKYDTDKDGALSAEEKAAMDADKEKKKAERAAKKEAKKAAEQK